MKPRDYYTHLGTKSPDFESKNLINHECGGCFKNCDGNIIFRFCSHFCLLTNGIHNSLISVSTRRISMKIFTYSGRYSRLVPKRVRRKRIYTFFMAHYLKRERGTPCPFSHYSLFLQYVY